MGMTIDKPYRFIGLSEDIEELKKMREYNNQIIPDKSTAIAVDTNEQFIFQDGKWRKVIEDGMTIDEYIKRMGDIRSNYDRWSGLGLTPNEAKAFDMSIETMRKYQTIQEIVKQKNYDRFNSHNYYGYFLRVQDIKKVVEDGNDR